MELLTSEQLDKAVEYLIKGRTLVFPTETSYGMGCDATNQRAVDKIFLIKNRSKLKSLLVIVPSIEDAKKYLAWNDQLDKLSAKYWPGPLTIVGEYNKEGTLAQGVISTENTVAIRVSQYDIPKSLLEKLSKPIVATSANLSGESDLYSGNEVIKVYFSREFQPDAIIDNGELPKNLPTTIVQVVGGQLKILRQGELGIKI